jgi:hypothetical protein
MLLTLQDDNWIRSLDLTTGKTKDLLKLNGATGTRHLAAVSPDATLIAVSRAPYTAEVEILKLANGEKGLFATFSGWLGCGAFRR